jgi:hypothetical protein
MNFTRTSPFRHLLPPASELWSDPAHFFTAWISVVQLHERDRNEKVSTARRRNVDDVMKRRHYQQVHGLDKDSWITNALGGNEADKKEQSEESAVATAAPESDILSETARQDAKPRKRFGIF